MSCISLSYQVYQILQPLHRNNSKY